MKIALTFDDGPSDITNDLVQVLQENGEIKATFFVMGASLTPERETVTRTLVNAGHKIGNHSDTHPHFSELSPEQIINEQIRPVEEKLDRILRRHYSMVLVRPPYGDSSHKVNVALMDAGYIPTFWNIDPKDWDKATTSAEIVENVKRAVANLQERDHEYAIIVLHDHNREDTGANTLAALPIIIRELKKANHRFFNL